ncbi:signal peptidase I [bacterium]|jgi:signal peptidase I|nr:signal peptidase I [bacterium]
MQDQSSGNTPSKNPKLQKKWIIENVLSLGLALLIVLMIRSSVVEAFKIPSGSMIPTLLIGDHIFVNKFAYGFKLPFSDWVMDHPVYLIKREPPKRGDIIVFKYPRDESFYYIKRVVGIPGDKIEQRNKVLYINDQMVNRDLIQGESTETLFKILNDSKYTSASIDVFNEKLNDANHLIMLEKTSYINDSFGPITVPSESLFVMGDNRDFSNDSRFWGFVPMKNVKGKAMVVWLSLWVSFSEGHLTFRPDRTGTLIH